MDSMAEVLQDECSQTESRELLEVIKMSVVEKRQRLSWQEKDVVSREVVGRWIDDRHCVGDKITLYRQGNKVFLETWYSDGCHSLDEMMSTQTEDGLKLEDKGGNIFGEYFLLSAENHLRFCNSSECFYTAKAA